MLNFIHYIHISYEEFFTLRKYLLLFCILHFDLAYKSVFGLDSTQALMLGTFPNLSTRLASLGNLARTALSTDSEVHVDMEVGPSQVVAHKVLASSGSQLLLQLSQSGLKSHISKVLQTCLVLGKVELDPRVDEVLDDVNHLVHLGLLEAVVPGKANLPGDK